MATTEGKVTGWRQAFSSGTRLAQAEAALRAGLPTDARQTASWRGSFAAGAGFCEFVNYQSASLASQLADTKAPSAGSNIGAAFYEETPHSPGSSSIATVNSATVRATPYTQGEPC